MSAIATKKRGSDEGLLLTYPAGFQVAYEMMGSPQSYFPSYQGTGIDLMVGSHYQAQYHEQKRLDADQSVMDGLQARRSAEQKLLTGPHNYHVPKPVLSQRRYANPSYGSGEYSSTRRDNGVDAPFRTIEVGSMGMEGSGSLRGGVRTNEGYSFYRGQLQRRIGQLDRLDALAEGYAVPMGQQYVTDDPESQGSPDKITFYYYFNSLLDLITDGDFGKSREIYGISRMMIDTVRSLLQFGPTIDEPDELEEIVKAINPVVAELTPMADDEGGLATFSNPQFTQTLLRYLTAMGNYATTMVQAQSFYLQPREREALSRSIAKSLKIDRLGGRTNIATADIIEAAASVDGREFYDRMARGDFGSGFSDDSSGGDGGDDFDRPAETREDSEANNAPRAPFSGRAGDPQRERFGAVGRRGATRESAFFGEDGTNAGAEEGIAYPLDMAGYDPLAQGAPEGNVEAIGDTLDSVIKIVLEPLKTAADNDLDLDEVVAKHYPQKQTFVSEVERAMEERGFSKPQIALAMSATNADVFQSYVTENAGPIGPSRAEPAYRYRPSTSTSAPLYTGSLDSRGPPDTLDPYSRSRFNTADRFSAAPSGEYRSSSDVLASVGFPANRDELRIRVKTIGDLMRVGALLTPPYVPRDGTKVQNGITALIAKVRKIDPSY